jgi:hypothetical protein
VLAKSLDLSWVNSLVTERKRQLYDTNAQLRRMLLLTGAPKRSARLFAPVRFRRIRRTSAQTTRENFIDVLRHSIASPSVTKIAATWRYPSQKHTSRRPLDFWHVGRVRSTGVMEGRGYHRVPTVVSKLLHRVPATLRSEKSDIAAVRRGQLPGRIAFDSSSELSRTSFWEDVHGFSAKPANGFMKANSKSLIVGNLERANFAPKASYAPPTRTIRGSETSDHQQIGRRSDSHLTSMRQSNDAIPGKSTDTARPTQSSLYIDGAALGRWTLDHVTRALSRPPMGLTSVDPRIGVPRTKLAPF